MARRSALSTWAAIILALLVTVPYLAIFVHSLRAALDPESVAAEDLRELATLGTWTLGADARIAFAYLSGTIGAVTLVVLLVIAGLVARRPAAREAAFAVFGAMALVAGLAALGGLLGGGWSRGSWLGAATGLSCLAVVILLSLKTTATDFELADMARRGPASEA